MNVPAYPLHWPPGWLRARPGSRRRAPFKRGDGTRLTIAEAVRRRLMPELERLHAREITISTNVPPHRYDQLGDGIDPGVAVYFMLDGQPRVLACDRWDRTADNVAAISAHVEALRGQERWGVGSLEQAFAGYKALPAAGGTQAWWEVLGLPPDARGPLVKERWRELLARLHPDREGGDADRAAAVNAAYSQAESEGRA